MLKPMPARKRPRDRHNPRVTIEVYDDDRELWLNARLAAVRAGLTLRELVQAAVREYLDRADLPPSA